MKRGFTLVELSIVLVIVGLLIGGILVGQSMISTAKLSATIRQIQQYDIAASNFKTKYNSLPGDTKLMTPAGDGDGQIFASTSMFYPWGGGMISEMFNFWKHLNNSGDLAQPYSGVDGATAFAGDFTGMSPKLDKVGNGCYINPVTVSAANGGDQDFGNSWIIAAGNTTSVSFVPCMTAIEAFSLDNKLDDGVPYTGNIQVDYPSQGPRAVGYLSGCNQVGGQSPYDVAGNMNWTTNMAETSPHPERIECALLVKAGW